MKFLLKFPSEAIIWIASLVILPLLCSPESTVTLCPFHNLGISFCPGCGLGKSIIYLFRLDLQHSLQAHPLGIPAVLILLHRIYTLLKNSHPLSERKIYG